MLFFCTKYEVRIAGYIQVLPMNVMSIGDYRSLIYIYIICTVLIEVHVQITNNCLCVCKGGGCIVFVRAEDVLL